MSMSATPSTWKAVETAIRGEKRSSAHSSSSCGSCPSNSTESSPASSSSISSRLATLDSGEDRQLVVAQAVAEGAEVLALAPQPEPRRDQPVDRFLEVLGGHAPEHRPRDRRPRAEAAAQEDVVRLPPLPRLVPDGRALEAEVADPVLGAGVRAAVEVEAQPRDLVAEARLEVADECVHTRLRLG